MVRGRFLRGGGGGSNSSLSACEFVTLNRKHMPNACAPAASPWHNSSRIRDHMPLDEVTLGTPRRFHIRDTPPWHQGGQPSWAARGKTDARWSSSVCAHWSEEEERRGIPVGRKQQLSPQRCFYFVLLVFLLFVVVVVVVVVKLQSEGCFWLLTEPS